MSREQLLALRAMLAGYDPAALSMDDAQLAQLLAQVVKKGGGK